MKFSDIPFQPYTSNGSYGRTARIRFENDYQLSVVQIFDELNGNSHGADEGLYEAALLKNGELCYDTPLTGYQKKLFGFLNESDVEKLIDEVNKL